MTDADGNIAQHIEYIPYGEVFVEERNNSFSTNFLFNAKELDNETGIDAIWGPYPAAEQMNVYKNGRKTKSMFQNTNSLYKF